MRIGVVVDATCDLPQEFIEQNDIRVLPVHIRLGADTLTDVRDSQETLRFYTEHLDERGLAAETAPFSPDEIRDEFLSKIVLDYDCVFVITVSSTRSPIFENAQKAAFSILNEYKSVRESHGVPGLFSMRVIDSLSMFAGTAVLAAEAVRLIKEGHAHNQIRKQLEDLRDHVSGFLVPSDLFYIRTRAKQKGEKSVGLMTYAIGSALDIKPVIRAFQGETEPVAKVRHYEGAVEAMFDHVARRIQDGLHAPHICISYGGDPERIPELPGYAALAAVAREHNVQVMHSIMSATAAVNAGGGCVTVALAADIKPFKD